MQKPDPAGLPEFLKPLNEVMVKANALTEGRRSDFFNHLKAATDSLSALAWIAFTGKDCGKGKNDCLCMPRADDFISYSLTSNVYFSLFKV